MFKACLFIILSSLANFVNSSHLHDDHADSNSKPENATGSITFVKPLFTFHPTTLVFVAENFLSLIIFWITKKDKNDNVSTNKYSKISNIALRTIGAAFSFFIIQNCYKFESLFVGFGFVYGIIIVGYTGVMTKHKTAFKKQCNNHISVISALVFPTLKAFLYFYFPIKATFIDYVKLLGSAIYPLIIYLFELIISKNCNWVLSRIPTFLPKLAPFVLSTSGYEKIEIKDQCFFVQQNQHICNTNIVVEMYGKKVGNRCILHFIGDGFGGTSWIAKLQENCNIQNKIKNVVISENAINLKNGETINTLLITFETPKRAEKFVALFNSFFSPSELPSTTDGNVSSPV